MKKNDVLDSGILLKPSFLICLFAVLCIGLNPFLTTLPYGYDGVFFSGVLLIGVVLALCVFAYKKGVLTAENFIFALFFIAFIVKVVYVANNPHYMRQHDSGRYDYQDGHLAYIQYYVNNNFKLPDFDPRTIWQFYHPPLSHMIFAGWMSLQNILDADILVASESLQTLSLFYSTCSSVMAVAIVKMLNLSNKAFIISSAIIILHPQNVAFSGLLNNDPLAFLLMLCTIYLFIKWYKNPTFMRIIIAALFMGFAMLAKTSAVYIAPALAFLFIYKFIKLKQERKILFAQYALFGTISIPIGLSWLLRSYILFGVPFSYVPFLGLDNHQYRGTGADRIFIFDFAELVPFMSNWNTYSDENIFLYMLRTSMFGEWEGGNTNAAFVAVGAVLFYINLLLVLLSVFAMVYTLAKKSNIMSVQKKVFITILYVAVFGSYIIFCFTHPFMCTMNYRYIPITFVIGSAFIGCALHILKDSKNKFAKVYTYATYITTFLFCSFAVFSHLIISIT